DQEVLAVGANHHRQRVRDRADEAVRLAVDQLRVALRSVRVSNLPSARGQYALELRRRRCAGLGRELYHGTIVVRGIGEQRAQVVVVVERTADEALDIGERPVLVLLRREDAAPRAEERFERVARLRGRRIRQRGGERNQPAAKVRSLHGAGFRRRYQRRHCGRRRRSVNRLKSTSSAKRSVPSGNVTYSMWTSFEPSRDGWPRMMTLSPGESSSPVQPARRSCVRDPPSASHCSFLPSTSTSK